jgi:hypothetical protein
VAHLVVAQVAVVLVVLVVAVVRAVRKNVTVQNNRMERTQ